MPFDPSGNYTRTSNWQADKAAGIKIVALRHDEQDDDFATALSTTLTKDGRSQPTADLPMNGHQLINLGNPTQAQHAATKKYVDDLRAFATSISIAGSDTNGRITFGGTGTLGTAYTAMNLFTGVIPVDVPAESPPSAYPNRWAINSKADATGTDLFAIDTAGNMRTSTGVMKALASAGSYVWQFLKDKNVLDYAPLSIVKDGYTTLIATGLLLQQRAVAQWGGYYLRDSTGKNRLALLDDTTNDIIRLVNWASDGTTAKVDYRFGPTQGFNFQTGAAKFQIAGVDAFVLAAETAATWNGTAIFIKKPDAVNAGNAFLGWYDSANKQRAYISESYVTNEMTFAARNSASTLVWSYTMAADGFDFSSISTTAYIRVGGVAALGLDPGGTQWAYGTAMYLKPTSAVNIQFGMMDATRVRGLWQYMPATNDMRLICYNSAGTALQVLMLNSAGMSLSSGAAAGTVITSGNIDDYLPVAGSGNANVTFPIGSYLMAHSSTYYNRGQAVQLRLDAGTGEYAMATGTGAVVTGTWVSRGRVPTSPAGYLMQRIA